ncbi:hypothetical protein [Streptomyces avidinii]|uniref:Uncharacterized protein n=1 Tax=Streptomyces avidinii TaxID=1895 RepID=A0ABS4L2C5_STRAV|nr:hypothetical protein [Streptomyces avidinii]MBP2036442.1 hypothetical protein [Streptomyces avidinii]GGY81577.1 hypothetical protein GCM10010343_02750 [Streptomyces avidinii]
MHIPAYAHDAIRAAALPSMPTSRQVGGLDCCLCDKPFGKDLAAIPLGPTPRSGLFGCRPCLTRSVTRARRSRDAARTHDAERARAESAAWMPVRERHLARLDSVRQAAEAVAGLARGTDVEALRVAWLLVSLESAYTWVPDTPEPPASVDRKDSEMKDEAFRLDLAMIAAREAVAERLAYHLLNEAQPEEPEMCEEFECPEDCSGRHDSTHIDCGPDSVFEDLAHHGITVEQPEPESLAPRLAALLGRTEAEEKHSPLPDIEEQAPVVLAHHGIDADDTAVLVSAAAVGLVADAWREGPLDVIHAADDGPSDGEIFAQSIDLYRRARAALVGAKEDGPEVLLAFVAVASNVDLPWAGGSRFAMRTVSASTAEFVQHVDDRVRFTAEVMREQGWRAGVLHRAASAVFKAPAHFGMPGWPGVVASAMERLALLDRSDAPGALADLAAVEVSLLEAPDRLGADALDWISHHALLGWRAP